jgi:hypothetical protein
MQVRYRTHWMAWELICYSDGMAVSLEDARKAKEDAKVLLAGLDVGVGITEDGEDFALKVNLRDAGQKDKIPSSINGVPVRTEVVGEISKQSTAL